MSAKRFYVDASIIAGLVLGDIDVEPILSIIGEDGILSYSRFGFGEVTSAIAARVRAINADDEEAAKQISALDAYLAGWRQVRSLTRDLDRAIELTMRASLALKLPDAIHIAIAERLALPLLTADRQQWRAAQMLDIATQIPLLPKVDP